MRLVPSILLIIMLLTSCNGRGVVNDLEVEKDNLLINMKNINIVQLVKFGEEEQVARENVEEEKENRPDIDGVLLDDDLLDYIWNKSEEYDIAYTFVLAIIGVESDYGRVTKNRNKNGTVDSGLMQINSSNVKWLKELAGIDKVDPQNDYHSVDMAFELLKYERDFWREKEYSEESIFVLTCMSYNMGRGNTIKYIQRNGIKENGYVNKVSIEKGKLESKIFNY